MTTPVSLAAVQVADTDLLEKGGEKFMRQSAKQAILLSIFLQLCDESRELSYTEIIGKSFPAVFGFINWLES